MSTSLSFHLCSTHGKRKESNTLLESVPPPTDKKVRYQCAAVSRTGRGLLLPEQTETIIRVLFSERIQQEIRSRDASYLERQRIVGHIQWNEEIGSPETKARSLGTSRGGASLGVGNNPATDGCRSFCCSGSALRNRLPFSKYRPCPTNIPPNLPQHQKRVCFGLLCAAGIPADKVCVCLYVCV